MSLSQERGIFSSDGDHSRFAAHAHLMVEADSARCCVGLLDVVKGMSPAWLQSSSCSSRGFVEHHDLEPADSTLSIRPRSVREGSDIVEGDMVGGELVAKELEYMRGSPVDIWGCRRYRRIFSSVCIKWWNGCVPVMPKGTRDRGDCFQADRHQRCRRRRGSFVSDLHFFTGVEYHVAAEVTRRVVN